VRIQKTPVAAAAENGQPDNGGEKQQRFAPFERVARQHLPLRHAQRLVEADKQPDHKRQADKISRCQYQQLHHGSEFIHARRLSVGCPRY
jgi:hypothetical protein